MPKASRTASRRRAPSARKTGHAMVTATACATPLLQLHAHWTMQAHPRYLEAATFLWR